MPVSTFENHCREGKLTFDDPFLDSGVVWDMGSTVFLALGGGRQLERARDSTAPQTHGFVGGGEVQEEERSRSQGFRVQGSGFRVQGAGFRVQGLVFRVWGARVGTVAEVVRVRGSEGADVLPLSPDRPVLRLSRERVDVTSVAESVDHKQNKTICTLAIDNWQHHL